MKRIFPLLVALFAAAPALAAHSVKESDLPDIFKKEPPFVQNQICGELMASMARMSADLFAASGQAAMKDAAVMAGTRAMVFIKANATLSADEGARAKRIAEQLERQASAANPVIGAYGFCEARAQRWLKEGVITPADYRMTEGEVRAALDSSVKPKAPKR